MRSKLARNSDSISSPSSHPRQRPRPPETCVASKIVLAACRRGSALDLLASGGTLIGVSIPLFWLGLLLSHLFAHELGWLPPSGRLTIGIELQSISETYALRETFLGPLGASLTTAADFASNFYILNSILTANPAAMADALSHLALPALTLSTVPLAITVRMTSLAPSVMR